MGGDREGLHGRDRVAPPGNPVSCHIAMFGDYPRSIVKWRVGTRFTVPTEFSHDYSPRLTGNASLLPTPARYPSYR